MKIIKPDYLSIMQKSLRLSIWKKYAESSRLCFAGCGKQITSNNFECGYVISSKHGGPIELENLRPICSECSNTIGEMNLTDFIYLRQYNLLDRSIYEVPYMDLEFYGAGCVK